MVIPEKEPRKIIARFQADFETYLRENPEVGERLKRDLLTAAGLRENELVDQSRDIDLGFVKVPVGKLSLFGTQCGNMGNKPFSEEVIQFLRSRGVKAILALGGNKELMISSAIIEMSEKDAEKLERMINKKHGSLRPDPSRVKGWMMFESE